MQTLPREQWELLVIDNASNERLAEAWDLSWHPCARHIRENNPGLTPARLRGIKESCSSLLIFVDDDNVLAPDFLEKAVTILGDYPYLGVFGAGILEPEFETEPPPELVPHLSMLALRSVAVVRWSNNNKDYQTIPWGAGICVTRRVANHYLQLVDQLNVSALIDRREQHLFAGGDDLFSWASVAVGQGFGLFPELRVTHLISAGRLNQRYFLRLIHDHAFSHGILNYLLTGILPKRIDALRLMRLLLQGIKNGLFTARFQWAESCGSDRASRFISKTKLQAI
jgi:glycosyltransferase involved in cell wall biosynthesis